jgi:hypothetical protein
MIIVAVLYHIKSRCGRLDNRERRDLCQRKLRYRQEIPGALGTDGVASRFRKSIEKVCIVGRAPRPAADALVGFVPAFY